MVILTPPPPGRRLLIPPPWRELIALCSPGCSIFYYHLALLVTLLVAPICTLLTNWCHLRSLSLSRLLATFRPVGALTTLHSHMAVQRQLTTAEHPSIVTSPSRRLNILFTPLVARCPAGHMVPSWHSLGCLPYHLCFSAHSWLFGTLLITQRFPGSSASFVTTRRPLCTR